MLGERRRRVLVIPINGASGASTSRSGELCGGTMRATPFESERTVAARWRCTKSDDGTSSDAPCASRA
jgi:hypothetical protein